MAKIFMNQEATWQIEIQDPLPKVALSMGSQFSNFSITHGSMDYFNDSEVVGRQLLDVAIELLEKWHPDALARYSPDCTVKLERRRWYITRKGSRTRHLDCDVICQYRLGDMMAVMATA